MDDLSLNASKYTYSSGTWTRAVSSVAEVILQRRGARRWSFRLVVTYLL